MRTNMRIVAAIFLACGALAGCRNSDQLETAAVTGKITLNGKPLGKGIVIFTPALGRAARGLIDAEGAYQLTTYKNGDGAIVGRHGVAVVVADENSTGGVEGGIVSIVPFKYAVPATSGLEFDVRSSLRNEANFDLKSP